MHIPFDEKQELISLLWVVIRNFCFTLLCLRAFDVGKYWNAFVRFNEVILYLVVNTLWKSFVQIIYDKYYNIYSSGISMVYMCTVNYIVFFVKFFPNCTNLWSNVCAYIGLFCGTNLYSCWSRYTWNVSWLMCIF